MPVNTPCKEYTRVKLKWETCRDAISGDDAVKDKGETYLPKLSGQKPKDYAAYKGRPVYFNASGRTEDGLSGLIFRKRPVRDLGSVEPYEDDITMSGITLDGFAESVVGEVLEVGRSGILADFPQAPEGEAITVKEAESMGRRPYLALYKAESIINWKVGRVNNNTILVMVILKESVSIPDPEDEFAEKVVDQYRVLDLFEGKYRVRLYRETESSTDKSDFEIIEDGEFFPQMNGGPLPYIPFIFVGPRDTSADISKPPLLDLAKINLSHYRSLADLENGMHWTGIPTPVFIGMDESEGGIMVGSSTGICIPNPDGDAKFLEFTGQGLDGLRAWEKEKREMMAVLGARILAADKRMVEAAETAEIHRAGETSVLASIANAVSAALVKALEIVRDWSKGTGEITYQLNTDYLPRGMDPQMLIALVQALQTGSISRSEFFEQLKAGEMIKADKTLEEHEAEIEAEPPALGIMGEDDAE